MSPRRSPVAEAKMWRTLGAVWEEDEDTVDIGVVDTGSDEVNGLDEETRNDENYGDVDDDVFRDSHICIEKWQPEVERFQAQGQEREYGSLLSSPSCFI